MTQEEFERLVPMQSTVRNIDLDGVISDYVYAGDIENYSEGGEWCLLRGMWMAEKTTHTTVVRKEHLISDFEVIRNV